MNRLLPLLLLAVAALADDPITVDPDQGGGGMDLSGTDLTAKYCKLAMQDCGGDVIEEPKFAFMPSQCHSRCTRNLLCMSVYIDENRQCFLLGERSTKGKGATGDTYYRLKKGESCPDGTKKYTEMTKKYSNSYCMIADKACPGHNLYEKPQNIDPYIKCLKKCSKIKACGMVDFHQNEKRSCEPMAYQCSPEEMVDAPGTVNYIRLEEGVDTCSDDRGPAGPPDEAPKPAPVPEPVPEPSGPVNPCETDQADVAGKNIAFKKDAIQSGIGWDGQPTRAVDGNDSGNYWDYSCTHTDQRNMPYWAVNLGQEYGVTGVTIKNREDCCGDRLKNYHVIVTNTRPSGAQPTYTDSEICAFRKDTHSGTLNLQCDKCMKGRYVMIQLLYFQYLTLCEVGVYAGKLPPGTWVHGDVDGNVARAKPTWQTGIGWDGKSGRAVDGITNGDYGGKSCTHTDHRNMPYWVVDLGGAYGVSGVKITNRADCCSERLKNYKVVVTNTKPAGDRPEFTPDEVCAFRQDSHTGTLALKCSQPINGQYVMIQLQYQEYLTLCEVEVYAGELPEGEWVQGDGAGNIARSKETWQSGIGWDGQSDRAVDGNPSGNYWHHSCTHTDLRAFPYWAVNLGQQYSVSGIRIHNRVDCCSDRLQRFKVVVTNTRPAGDRPVFNDNELCAYRHGPFSGVLELSCDNALTGQYVMIQLQYTQYLTLCEVEVFTGDLPSGNWISGDAITSNTNVAFGKSAYQTGEGWNGNPNRALDGNESGNYWDNSCTHTDLRDNPYWYVDLGQPTAISKVAITNRADCCSDRLKNYKVVVTNTRPAGDSPSYSDAEVCSHEAASHSGTKEISCSKTGQYVMIQLQYREYLTLCEVKVFAA